MRTSSAATLDAGDSTGLEQGLDSTRQLLDDAALARQHRTDIDRQLAGRNTVLAELLVGPVIELRGLEQRLGRDAADIETGAAKRLALARDGPVVDAGRRHAELSCAYGGRIASGASADHDEVEFLVCHSALYL